MHDILTDIYICLTDFQVSYHILPLLNQLTTKVISEELYSLCLI